MAAISDFADDTFKCIFLNENVWIAIDISLKFIPKVLINDILALVQRWHSLPTKYVSLGLNELIHKNDMSWKMKAADRIMQNETRRLNNMSVSLCV